VSRVSGVLRVARHAVRSGFQDYQIIYTWKTWLAGWYVRVLAQVIFFALIGRLLGSDAQTHFLLVGNAAMLAAMAGIWGGINMTGWERGTGTLPLLVASPSSPVIVFASRGLYLVANVGLVLLMTLCGVNVPLQSYPAPVYWIAQFLPLTHGLSAIRAVLDGDLGIAGQQALLEAAVGLGWLALCLVTFERFVRHGRNEGTLDLGA
jgi:ABC-2 type transport system permease protein